MTSSPRKVEVAAGPRCFPREIGPLSSPVGAQPATYGTRYGPIRHRVRRGPEGDRGE